MPYGDTAARLDPVATVDPERPAVSVSEAFDRLAQQLETAHAIAGELDRRLEPVLSPLHEDPSVAPYGDPSCLVADRILSFAVSIAGLAAHLDRLNRRIAL